MHTSRQHSKPLPSTSTSDSTWDLSLVLKGLTRPHFKSMATCSLIYLSMKMAFLVAITLARRKGEIAALMAHPSYTVFFPHKVTLSPHPKFILKVTSQFHMNQLIHLPIFCPNPN